MPESVTFVLCIEQNAILEQALLLCESVRRFAGAQRLAPIVAVSPRGLGVDRATQAHLSALDVHYVDAALNVDCPCYGSANRVVAAAWAERHADTDWVIVLDSDTVVLDALELPLDADVGVRPVDTKGSATSGPDDPFEDYWRRLAALDDVSLAQLPLVATTDGLHRVRASYNGGLVAARRRAGILSAWADLFGRSVRSGLRPWRDSGLDVHASTGYVGTTASEYWGSNQAAAAVAIWGRTRRVHHYSDRYNVPLHLLAAQPRLRDGRAPAAPVHVHYHWLFSAPHHETALATLAAIGVPPDRLAWLRGRLPLPALCGRGAGKIGGSTSGVA